MFKNHQIVGLAIIGLVVAFFASNGISNASPPTRTLHLVAPLKGPNHVGWAEYVATPYFRMLTARVQVKSDAIDSPPIAIACVQRGQLMAKLCEVGCDPSGVFSLELLAPDAPMLRRGDKIMFINPADGTHLCTGVLQLPVSEPEPPHEP